MSNVLAIAAVTSTLRNLLQTALDTASGPAGTSVTTLSPDVARTGRRGNQLNLFLYQTSVNPAWRNRDMPLQAKPNEVAFPPLPLDLYYMITAYGLEDDDVTAHHVMGHAMSTLHDHCLLGAGEIRTALADNDLHLQVERIRITPQPVSVDELSKLWTTFQTQYRLSTCYEVGVVLIESTRPAKAALPVLRRGADDRGPAAVSGLIPPYPTLFGITPPNKQPSALLGDALIATGHHLDGTAFRMRCTHRHLEDPLIIPDPAAAAIVPALSTEVSFTLPNVPADVPAGIYMASAVIEKTGQPTRTSNEVPFAVAPRITNLPQTVNRAGDGSASIVLQCTPEVLPEQRAALLLGDREVVAQAHPAQTGSLTFDVPDAEPGEHLVRLRVDGVESLLIDYAATPLAFDQSQKVTIV